MRILKNKEDNILVVSALLHDIGKLDVRSEKHWKGKHYEESIKYIEKISEGLKETYKLEDQDIERIKFIVKNHHNDIKTSKDPLLKILIFADKLAAKADRRKAKTIKNGKIVGSELSENIKNIPLLNILSSINTEIFDGQYYLTKDSFDALYDSYSFFLPTTLLEFIEYFSGNLELPDPKNYMISRMYDELRKKAWDNLPDTPDLFVLDTYLMNYLYFVPSISPSEKNKGDLPDISLYHHLKLTSAISLALKKSIGKGTVSLNEVEEMVETEFEGESKKIFTIIGGDISGIQDYISSSPNEYASRLLKAASLRIQLITHAVAHYIIEKLGLSPQNIIYNSAGAFYILSHLLDEKEIEELKETIYKSINEAENGAIFLSIEKIDLTPKELASLRIDDKTDVFYALNKKLKKEKRKKPLYHKLFLDTRTIRYDTETGRYRSCVICGEPGEKIQEGEKTVYLCRKHRSMLQLYSKLKNSSKKPFYMKETIDKKKNITPNDTEHDFQISFADEEKTIQYNITIDFTQKITNEESNDKEIIYYTINPHLSRHYSINNTVKNQVAIFIPIHFPLENDIVKDIESMANSSKKRTGTEKYGVLKADVDSLGNILKDGLGEYKSLSRIAYMSSLLNLYFTAIIPLMLHKKEQWKNDLYLIYSGGDDLFIIGAWDILYDFAVYGLYPSFRDFTSWNPNITISMAFGIFPRKFKLRRAFELVEEDLEHAKDVEGEPLKEYLYNELKKKVNLDKNHKSIKLEELIENRNKVIETIEYYIKSRPKDTIKEKQKEINYLNPNVYPTHLHIQKIMESPKINRHLLYKTMTSEDQLKLWIEAVTDFLKLTRQIKNRTSILSVPLRRKLLKEKTETEFEYMEKLRKTLVELSRKQKLPKRTIQKIYYSSKGLESNLYTIVKKKEVIPAKIYRLKYWLYKPDSIKDDETRELYEQIWKIYEDTLSNSLKLGTVFINPLILKLAAKMAELFTRTK